ncbi:hypothetical protein M0638_00550 [Roseomonas sp. NAR14]|uniref:Uncharacterized protein n=1 Tax=Roseomonas acroporae TaxID=2937791 RepID=A0A9X1Y3P9_9PROT|nr:hypothetical protein [Roseomonas acroporae]MCK8782868.1 hypothetical protein [Roseomonas acroporae]
MFPALILCFVATFAAMGGLASVALALLSGAGMGSPALLAAPLFGAVSLLTGLTAAWLVMAQNDRRNATRG